VEEALEELYSTHPSDFTKKRDAIAKELKARGDGEAASAVRARRKPTQVAWVLNQLARRYPDDVAELVDVGRELAREQRKALRGEATASFRGSIDRQRRVVGGLTRKTADLMKELGVDPSGHLDEVASALQAALVDPAVGARLEEGRLEKPPEAAAGFSGPLPTGPLPRISPRPAKEARPERPAATRPRRGAETAAKKRAEARERAERQAQALAQKRALAKERAERQAAERAEKKAVAALRAAEREAEKRRKAAQKAEEEARKAIERAKELARAAEESSQRVAEAKRELARADVG